ncbi:hypothetical protein CapIbe_011184 [Capra ibex]
MASPGWTDPSLCSGSPGLDRCFLGASGTWPPTFLVSEPAARGIQLKTQPLENRCLTLRAHLSVSMHFL